MVDYRRLPLQGFDKNADILQIVLNIINDALSLAVASADS